MQSESEAPSAQAVESESTAEATTTMEAPGREPTYWLRVHGYPSDLTREVVYHGDFGDLMTGRLPDDPSHLEAGDVLVYYADGPGSLYGVATIEGDIEGPIVDPVRGQKWNVPIKREALIKVMNKMPHAAGIEPPSGLHFLWMVRDFTYIRLPKADGEYLVAAIKSRAGSKE